MTSAYPGQAKRKAPQIAPIDGTYVHSRRRAHLTACIDKWHDHGFVLHPRIIGRSTTNETAARS